MVKVVIGDRLGKGQAVAKGVEDAGGVAILIPGIGADMKLADVMRKEDADLGFSFCGSGGAGAITAQVKYDYSVAYGLNSIEAGIAALQEGKVVLGFVFMDEAELGRKMVKTFEALKK